MSSRKLENTNDPPDVSTGGGRLSTGLTVWLTGLSSSGKSSISIELQKRLLVKGYVAETLDGDDVRRHLGKELGFSKEDRDENIRRIAYVARILTRCGVIAVVSAISPYRAVRLEVKRSIGRMIEVYVNAPLVVCEQRDLKGIYCRGRQGELSQVTGLDDPYEPPLEPDVECRTDLETLDESVAKVERAIEAWLAGRRRGC